ncbi:MAG: AarF/ABC1/UbiB kinase family protein [Sandaracinaceae bacterium]|nr:AarF/ABC1/UbiB kinase family protein [Sandaracinaceae bacterium]
MQRAYHVVVRSLLATAVLFPMWLAYAVPFFLERRFGRAVAPEAWERKHERYAKRFYWLAVRMRGGLIKVGQILSTRVDIMPAGWTRALSGLQDEVDPLPWSRLEGHLERTYGRHPDELFAKIEREAHAAASFGQVHRARTKDGRDVALKIKYPDIELKLRIDLWFLGRAVRLFNVFLPRISLRPIYEEISRALSTELDYEQEARFTRIVHDNFRGREGVVIPEVIDALTTRDVICTTWFDGEKITKPSLLAREDLDRERLLERLLHTWIDMMYVDGVFQSDPHPGNLLVRVEDGAPILGVVDFGQVKVLTREFHQKLVGSVMAFAMGNESMFVGSLISLGLFPESEREKLAPLVGALMKRLRERRPAEGDMDFASLRDEVLGALDEMEGIVIPQEIVLYGRTFALLAGVTRAIAPGLNPIAVAKPLLTQALLAGGPPADPTAQAAAAS